MSGNDRDEQPSTFSRRALAGGLAATGVGALAAWGAHPAAAAAAAATAVDPSVYRVDVKDHGAKGDGTTDDSDAIRAAVAAAISGRKSGVVQKEIFFPPGNYRVTKKDTLMWSPTTGNADQVFGLRYRGGGARVTTITFDTDFAATDDPRENNLITAATRLRYTYFQDMAFKSDNLNNRFAYYWSVNARDENSQYPDYGHGQNQYFVYENVEWKGKWDRVIGLDGDHKANNNSEHHFILCSTDTVSEFKDAFLHCGISSPANRNLQNQFLNYFMLSCNFAVAGGDFFRFDRGGSINVIGGSWSTVGKDKPVRYFYMPLANGEISATRLYVTGVRFEPKGPDHKIIDCNWNNGSVVFTSCSDMAALQASNPGGHAAVNWGLHRYAATANRLPIVRYQDCTLAGFHDVDAAGSALTHGKMIYEGCRFYHNTSAVGTASPHFLRYRSAPKRFAFRDSWATPDAEG